MNRSQMRIRHVRLAFVAAAALSLALAAPGFAGAQSGTTYTSSGSYEHDGCGPIVDVENEREGRLSIRAGTGPAAGTFLVHETFSYTEIHTRRSDGKVAYVSGHGNLRETTAKHVSGSIYEVSAVQAGQPFTVFDASGALVLRDRVVLRETFLIDIENGEIVDVIKSSANGKWPGMTDAFCDFWNS